MPCSEAPGTHRHRRILASDWKGNSFHIFRLAAFVFRAVVNARSARRIHRQRNGPSSGCGHRNAQS